MAYLHLLKPPGKNEHMSSSDRFPLTPKRGKHILEQMEVYKVLRAGHSPEADETAWSLRRTR